MADRARRRLKALAIDLALILAFPAAALCWVERVTSTSEQVFGFLAQAFALLPGLPGMYLRRAFFQMTLQQCARDWYIGFGSFFTHRSATVEDGVYIGCFTLVGSAALRAGCLIGSHSSLLSGPSLHEWSSGEGWLPCDARKIVQIEIGARSWIGERAVVMADVGSGAMVAAGSVVSMPIAPAIMVAGNPARFVRRMAEPEAPDAKQAARIEV
jgi:virginiamycin A acetyltransferase